MAYMPSKAKLIDNPVSAPGFLSKMFLFPGVPKILEVMLSEFLRTFEKQPKILK